ncbi:antitoxin [Nanoarchaeota archaeon]
MVKAIISISKKANQVLNVVKAKHNFKDKSQAIDYVALKYGEDLLEPQLRPEFIEKMIERQKEPGVKIKDFKKHFGL